MSESESDISYDPSWLNAEAEAQAQAQPSEKSITYSDLMRRVEKQIATLFGKEGPHKRTVNLQWVSHWKTPQSDGLVRVECLVHHGIDPEIYEKAVAVGGIRPLTPVVFGLAVLFDPPSKRLSIQVRFVTSTGVPMIYEKRIGGEEVSLSEKIHHIVTYLSFLRTMIHIYDLAEALHMVLPSHIDVGIVFPKRPDPSAPLDTLWDIYVYGAVFGAKGRLAFTVDMVRANRVEERFIYFHSRGWERFLRTPECTPGRVVVAKSDSASNFNTHFYAVYSLILHLMEVGARAAARAAVPG